MFLLIAASIPLMAVVFVFGGVAPEDVAQRLHRADRDGPRARLVRAVLLEPGQAHDGGDGDHDLRRPGRHHRDGVHPRLLGRDGPLRRPTATGVAGPFGIRAPAVLAYLNPFIAQADVLCGTEATFGGFWCSAVQGLAPTQDGVVFLDNGGGLRERAGPGADARRRPGGGRGRGADVPGDDLTVVMAVEGDGPAADVIVEPQQVLPARDSLWPKSVATWLILSVIFLFLSVQAVSPTRRWRLRRGKRPRPTRPDHPLRRSSRPRSSHPRRPGPRGPRA